MADSKSLEREKERLDGKLAVAKHTREQAEKALEHAQDVESGIAGEIAGVGVKIVEAKKAEQEKARVAAAEAAKNKPK